MMSSRLIQPLVGKIGLIFGSIAKKKIGLTFIP